MLTTSSDKFRRQREEDDVEFSCPLARAPAAGEADKAGLREPLPDEPELLAARGDLVGADPLDPSTT